MVKVHGLGLTAADLCHGYQWTSVDSRTWLQAGAYGKVPFPRYVDGRPDYRSQAKSVSARSPGARRHIDRLSGFDFDRLCRFLKVEVGDQPRTSPLRHARAAAGLADRRNVPHGERIWTKAEHGSRRSFD